MVSQFPIDVMHQIDPGVPKQVLLVIKLRKCAFPLSVIKVQQMNTDFSNFAGRGTL